MQTSASSSTACGDSSVNDLLHSPLLDSVPGNGLRHFHQLLDHLRHWYFDNLLDNLWYMDVCDLFTDLLRNSLPEVVANQAPLPCEKSIVKLTCPHDGQRSDDFFSEADLSKHTVIHSQDHGWCRCTEEHRKSALMQWCVV